MGEDPAAIRQQIEETRERMGDTVDALGYKADGTGTSAYTGTINPGTATINTDNLAALLLVTGQSIAQLLCSQHPLVTVPLPVPASLFWSVTCYDAQTRSEVNAEQGKLKIQAQGEKSVPVEIGLADVLDRLYTKLRAGRSGRRRGLGRRGDRIAHG